MHDMHSTGLRESAGLRPCGHGVQVAAARVVPVSQCEASPGELVTHPMQFAWSFTQSRLQRKRSHVSHPMGGVRARPLSNPAIGTDSANNAETTTQVVAMSESQSALVVEVEITRASSCDPSTARLHVTSMRPGNVIRHVYAPCTVVTWCKKVVDNYFFK